MSKHKFTKESLWYKYAKNNIELNKEDFFKAYDEITSETNEKIKVLINYALAFETSIDWNYREKLTEEEYKEKLTELNCSNFIDDDPEEIIKEIIQKIYDLL